MFPMVDTVVGNNAAAMAQDVVFVALHPPAIAEALAPVKSSLKPVRSSCRLPPSSP